ncbi:FkbM family methyltransferase [Ruegeria sp. MALMAid1280]|uniref:FkbM family methyltransferase n=1 Tax=Ruegeria sp. MALMAid1280 TaxID=3411634 RepID=UPI003B9F51C1
MKSSQRHPSKISLLHQLRDADFPIECVLDVGIHFGTHELMAAFPEKKHYLFEPIEEHFESIEKVYSGANIDFELNKVAVSNADGTAQLTVSTVVQGQDVTHARFAHSEAPTETLRTVPTLKLDTFVAEQAPAAPFLLKIDVDGAEEMILEGAQEAMKHCSVLILESPRDKIFDRMQLAMAAGFELLDIIDFCYYDGYLVQVDLVLINPKYAPPNFVNIFHGGFTLDKWHQYVPSSKKKRRLSRLFRKRK